MLVCVLLLSLSRLPPSEALLSPARRPQPGLCLAPRPAPQGPGQQAYLVGQSAGEKMSEKLLLLERLVLMDNDVIEPKRKRSFPGSNAPLDRLSISVMDTKQASKKRKVVELPRRRVSPAMDRIGVSRLPSTRG